MRRAATAGVWTKWRMVLVVGSGRGSAHWYSSVVPVVIGARSRYGPSTTDTPSDQHSHVTDLPRLTLPQTSIVDCLTLRTYHD
jgi:hypothetical protein